METTINKTAGLILKAVKSESPQKDLEQEGLPPLVSLASGVRDPCARVDGIAHPQRDECCELTQPQQLHVSQQGILRDYSESDSAIFHLQDNFDFITYHDLSSQIPRKRVALHSYPPSAGNDHHLGDNTPGFVGPASGGSMPPTRQFADGSTNGGVRHQLSATKLPVIHYVYMSVDGRVTRHKSLSGSSSSQSMENGSHGEATETDDMASGGGKNLGGDGKTFLPDLERQRREAKNHLNHSAAGWRKSKKDKPTDTISTVTTDTPQKKEEKEQLRMQYVVAHSILLQGKSFQVYPDYSGPKGVLRVLPKHQIPGLIVVDHGCVLHCVLKENYGWYELDGHANKGKSLVAASAFQELHLRPIRIDGTWTDARDGLVFMPLLIKLRQEFRNARAEGPITSSLLSAIKNVTGACKNMCDLAISNDVRTWFHDVCDNTEAVYRLQVMESFAQTNVSNNMFLPAVLAKHTLVRQRHGVVNRVNTIDLPLVKLNKEYEIKKNINIRHKGTTKPLTKEFWFSEKPWPLEPTLVVDDVYRMGRATHKWVTLTDTVRYSASACNLYGAVSRIIKARDGEEEYQQQQALLCVALRNTFGRVELWKLLNVHFKHLNTTNVKDGFVIDKYPYLDKVEYGGESDESATKRMEQECVIALMQFAPIIDAVKYLTTLMRPTLAEAVVDFAQNTLVQAQVAAYTLFSKCHIPLLWRSQYAEEPHMKRLERMRILANTVQDGTGCLVSKVGVHVKDEIAKNGDKMPRAFVSYGSGVLCAPTVPITFKERINGWHYFNVKGVEVLVIVYAKPKSSELIKLFEALCRARSFTHNHLCVAIYSDDSCYSGVINRVPFGFNVDISSCDSSNGPPIFFLVALLMSHIDEEFAILLVEQCCKPMTLQHPQEKDLLYELLLPTAFEGSGTVLTTCLNHIASFLIAIAVATQMGTSTITSLSDVEKCIVAGAKTVGHKVTVASIEVNGVLHNSRFQFLKISPMVCRHSVTGEYKLLPVRNIGSIIKGFGQLSEDMQAHQLGIDNATFNRMTYGERMDCFLGAVVRGYRNEASTPILAALRSRFSSNQGQLKQKFTLVDEDIDFSEYVVCDEELSARYGSLDYQVVSYNIGDLQLGDNLQADPVLQQIMFVDYEYEKPTNDIDFSMGSSFLTA